MEIVATRKSKVSTGYSLVDNILALFPNDILKDCFFISCRHLLPSAELLVDCLLQKQLHPKNIALIGKCYTASEITITNLQKKGIYIDKASRDFDSHISYYEHYKELLRDFLKRVANSHHLNDYKKIIILDDGGDLIKVAHEVLCHQKNIIGVEQTSRGAHQLQNFNLICPVVNVARSLAKLTYESPMVADAVMLALNKANTALGLSFTHALIIGNGSIGEALANLIGKKQLFRVTKYDVIKERSDLIEKQLSSLAGQVDLIIGCTGKNILSIVDKYDFLKYSVTLASVSSSDVEFGGASLRKEANPTTNCHEHIYLQKQNITLLNGGFPLNFDGGDEDQIPLLKFQFTTSLLLAGVLQAASANQNLKPNFIELDRKLQTIVINDLFQG